MRRNRPQIETLRRCNSNKRLNVAACLDGTRSFMVLMYSRVAFLVFTSIFVKALGTHATSNPQTNVSHSFRITPFLRQVFPLGTYGVLLVVVAAARTPSTIGHLFHKRLVGFQHYPLAKPKRANNTIHPMIIILDWRQLHIPYNFQQI